MQTIADYAATIGQVPESEVLNDNEKVAALELVADEIEGIVWQPHKRQEARELVAKAREAARSIAEKNPQVNPLDGLDRLASRGMLYPKADPAL